MRHKRKKLAGFIALVVALGLGYTASQSGTPTAAESAPQNSGSAQQAAPADGQAAAAAQQPAAGQQPARQAPAQGGAANAASELPDLAAFQPVAETAQLKLSVDSRSGHFRVEDKRSGAVWTSYPSPEDWPKETIQGTWRNNLRSPIIVEFIDMANHKSQPKLISFIEDKGAVEGFQKIDGGFKLTFDFKTSGFKIPVEVKLNGDAVETKVFDDGIEEGKLSLLNLKLYPMFGAAPSSGQEGYLFVPDGSGALIDFKENRTNDKSVYRESIYGNDASFFSESTDRLMPKIPVFGVKNGDKAMVAVMEGGEEYNKLFASPSGAYGVFNWITPELQYRIKFYQNTSRKANTGFYTYSKERFNGNERVTKYFLLNGEQSSYVGMASRYRQYLMETKGLKKLEVTGNKLPLFLDIVGADIKKGLVWDSYIEGTTTAQATEMVKRLYGLGIENMSIRYLGWQKGGYSSFGGLFPVDKRLGGNEGMKQFIRFADSLQIPVYLGVNYTINNNGKDSFSGRYEGMRNMAGQVLEYTSFANRELVTMVSPKYSEVILNKDLPDFKELGAKGLYFEDGIGRNLDSDFNNRYLSTRSETMKTQQRMLQSVKDTLGGVQVERPNIYTIGQANHLHRLDDDYSYDLFIDRPVPFLQIALHGLVTYTSDWANMRDQYRNEFLRSIEYGSYPSFIFTHAESEDMKGAFWIWYYSLNYRDWETMAVEEYQRYNEALGDVQNKFIVNHRNLAPKVFETTYEGGKRIIVNYDTAPYTGGGLNVPAQDFIVLTGGGGQ